MCQDILQTTDIPPIHKLPFYTAVTMYELDFQTFGVLAKMAKVDISVVNAMFVNEAVHRADAKKVLDAFSEYTRVSWTLDNMQVQLLPSFADICKQHHLDFPALAEYAEALTTVSLSIIDMMLSDIPVNMNSAIIVLGILSSRVGKHYGLGNVDVALETQQTQP